MITYHFPCNCYIKNDDPDLPAFYYDPIINPIPAGKVRKLADDDEDMEGEAVDQFLLPTGMSPLLQSFPVSTGNTAAGIALYWAPAPFNKVH